MGEVTKEFRADGSRLCWSSLIILVHAMMTTILLDHPPHLDDIR